MEGSKKWMWLCLALGVVVLLLAAGNVVQYMQNRQYRSEVRAAANTYSEEYLHLNSITYPTFQEKVRAGEDFLVSIGRPNCGDCRDFDPVFTRIVEALDMGEDIYYFNVASIRADEEAWAAFKEDYEIFYTPTFARYADGALASKIEWTSETGIHEDGVTAWMEAQKADAPAAAKAGAE